MTKTSVFALVGLATAGLALPAAAGSLEPPVVEPVVVANVTMTPDWTGAYGGVTVGYGDIFDNLDGNDWMGGIQAGYDWDLGNWVVGVGAEANFGSIETDYGNLDSLTQLKVRGGYDVGRTMFYAATGASYAASEDLQDSWGYFGGIGLETRVSDHISVSAEVDRHWFDDYRDFGTVGMTTGFMGLNYRF